MRHDRPPRSAVLRGLALALALLPCACMSSGKKKALDEPHPPRVRMHVPDVYILACPDLIEVVFDDWPEQDRVARIGPDGMAEIGELGRIHVEGDTVIEAGQKIAAQARLPFSKVRVRVAEFNSKQVFLFGQVRGSARAVSYQGPETIVELLRRTGGLSADAAPNEIHIVRSQLADAKPAEVLTVDLEAIRERNDQRTNYRVQPQDEIYVAAKPGSKLAQAVPPIVKPMYETIRALFAPKR